MTVPGWGWERDLEESIFKPQADAWGYRCGYERLGGCCGGPGGGMTGAK